jgi:hypothetical protein
MRLGPEGFADTIGTVSALAASTAALARYVRRHALTPAWIGAAIRLNTVTPGNIDELRVSADLNDDESIQELERFRVAAEAVAGRIVFALGPEARAFWRVAWESGIGTSSSGPSGSLEPFVAKASVRVPCGLGEAPMDTRAVFGLSVLMSFVAFGLITARHIVPRLRLQLRNDALVSLVVPHAFRLIGGETTLADDRTS